jgi:hypothetical protein
MFRRLLLAAAPAVLLTIPVTTSAHAKDCWFQGFNPFSGAISSDIKGHGIGIKESNACKRAKRKCLNKLRKAWKKGKAQQFACRKIGDTPGF